MAIQPSWRMAVPLFGDAMLTVIFLSADALIKSPVWGNVSPLALR
jgi:hypothetical protein